MAPGRATKRRRLSSSDDEATSDSGSNGASLNDFYSRAAEWDLEQEYERRPRKANKKEKERTRLPIKTEDGTIQHVEEPEVPDEESDSFLDSDGDEVEAPAPKEEEEVKEAPKVPLKVQIIQAKEEIARIASLINEDPEEHIASFKKLAEMVDKGSHPTIKKLALAAQAAVYRDVIPGYRIRELSEEDMKEKVSKEVRKLRNYEQALLSGYRKYVQKLSTLAKSGKGGEDDDGGMRSAAINCACSLLLAVPHFNFRGELLKILVNQLSKTKIDADFVKCRETLEEIFSKDDDGIVSLEAVRLLSKMMRAKEYRVHESVLDTFLHLRLLSEFSSKGSRDKVDKPSEENTIRGKKPKEKREFRTKKERKLERERKAVEKDMKEADALVAHEERDKNQAETLKLVFATYFRILKLRTPSLMGAVLEGLAKYAHLINQDFFGDLLEALRELILQAEASERVEEEDSDETELTPARNSLRETLLCTITAFALLEGQDASKAASSLHLDLGFFITHLYRALYPLSVHPDIEFNPNKSLRLPDPGSDDSKDDDKSAELQKPKNKVNFQTPTVLLLRCLQSILLARGHAAPAPVRLAGFTKRLMTTALQLPEKSSLAILSLLTRVVKQNGRKVAPLWNTEERKGDGVFNPYAMDVEESNVFAGTVWEGELLRLHYCPQVRNAAADVEKMIADVK